MAYPEPTEVAPWYLRNITQALELNTVTGQVFVRTNAALIGNVTVGNVGIGSLGNVDISGNSLPVTIESGNVTVLQGTSPWVVTGNTNVVITSSNVANSVVQTAVHSNTITDGSVVFAGLTSSRDEVEVSEDIKRRLQLKRDVGGTPVTLTLAVAYTQTNADLLYKLGWEELTN